MYTRISLFLFCAVFFSGLGAVEIPIVEGKCSCYKTSSRQSPANEIAKRWGWLQNDPCLVIRLKMTEADELHEHWTEYKELYFPAASLYKTLLKSVKDLKPAFYSSYYPSDFERLFDGLNAANTANEEWELFDKKFKYDRGVCKCGITGCYTGKYDEGIASIKTEARKNRVRWANRKREIWALFEQIHEMCRKSHRNLLTLYEHGYLQLKKGNFYTSMVDIKELIKLSKETNNTQYLSSDTYLTMGMVSSLSHEYGEALEALSEVITKNPAHTDAYVERAIVYFEMGDFNMAIKEYLAANVDATLIPPTESNKLQLAKGLLQGAPCGVFQRGLELPATLGSSLCGITQALWALVSHPIDTPLQMIDSAVESLEYAKSHDIRAISKEVTPELHELFQKWDHLSPEAQGKELGVLIGKYGVDILTVAGTTKGLECAVKLRRANALYNLKVLSTLSESTAGQGVFITAVKELMAERQRFFSSAKIQLDKQGKHIRGHRNYVADESRSILTHPEPDLLLKKYGGKGKAYAKLKAGKAGYKEVVVCDEIIGECIDRVTKTSTPTKRATIHYDKDGGAHIVPAPP